MDRRALLIASGLAFLVDVSLVWAGPIHDAARSGNVERIEQILEQGADLEERDGTRETPLISAALAGQVAVVRRLIGKGAKIQARNERGLTSLHAAAFGGHLAVVQLLIEQGAKVNDAENRFKLTPLHAAAEENRKAVVKALLAANAKVNAKEVNGYTPLSRAGWRENWEILAMLLEAGATCQPKDVAGDWLFNECAKRSK